MGKNFEITLVENSLQEESVKAIVKLEKQIAKLKKQQDAYKEALLAAMEANDVKKIETPDLDVTYVEPTTRETFDSKSLKEDNPDLYNSYIRISNVKGSIRIKVK